MDPSSLPPEDAETQDGPPCEQETRTISSAELFADSQEVQILHAGETYRLRKTRAGKLLLTK